MVLKGLALILYIKYYYMLFLNHISFSQTFYGNIYQYRIFRYIKEMKLEGFYEKSNHLYECRVAQPSTYA